MVDPSGGAEILVVAGLAVVVRTTAQRARGSPLDQYLPWYIVLLCGVLSEKFTKSLNSYAGIARVESDEG
jgi:beta-lactamase regulating signal transducer with metallopeptidase domain